MQADDATHPATPQADNNAIDAPTIRFGFALNNVVRNYT
jgi:hypothetical protein